jgi:hypothetical protein
MSHVNPDYFKSQTPDLARNLAQITNDQLSKMGLDSKKIDIDKLVSDTKESPTIPVIHPVKPSLTKGWVA